MTTAGTGRPRTRRCARRRESDATPPEVIVRWRKLPGSDRDLEQAARGIVETVTRFRQVRVDAPTLHAPVAMRDEACATAQAAAPLGCRIAPARIVGTQFVDESGTRIRLLLEDGTTIEVDERENARARRKLAAMDDLTPKRRQPARVLTRPGAPPAKRKLDPMGGLIPLVAEWGEIIWMPGADGASVGVLEMYENGNTAITCRVSGDENDTLAGQFGPNLGLCRQHSDILVPRMAIFAVNMSGTREIWPGSVGGGRSGAPQREDMLLLEQWIDEGWVEHIVARDDDRIARETIWHQVLRRHWKQAGVSLWLARFGRQMDYDKDRIALGAMSLVAEEERINGNRRMQAARIDKGPALGRGWGTRPRIGFEKCVENGIRQNMVQWPYILRMFELADVDDANALSSFKVADQMTAEGFPITRERVRTILADPIYSTGEWSVTLRGTEIPQTPILLENPVPIDRFQRIQDMLALRQGRHGVTPIGEFLVNYVETVHVQCEHERRQAKRFEERPLLKGYIDDKNSPDLRRIRHIPYVPECCRGTGRGFGGAHSWDRELIQDPIVREIRKIAEHPELQRQLALAARHQVASTRSRLTEVQREEIDRDIVRLEEQRNAELDRWVDGVASGAPIDRAEHDVRMRRLADRINALERRLQADAAAADAEANGGVPRDDERRLRDFLEILTVETPDDPFHKQLRARLFQRVIDKIEIDDPGSGPIKITLHGHLVPETAPAEASNPVHACHDLLDAYAKRKTRKDAEVAADGEAGSTTQTATGKGNGMAVWGPEYAQLLDMASTEEQERRRRMALDSIAWRQRITHARKPTGFVPSWRVALATEAPEREVGARYFRGRRQQRFELAVGVRVETDPYAVRVRDALVSLGEGSLVEIAGEASMHKQTASKWIGRLVRAGVVERTQAAGGHRSALYRLVGCAAESG